MRKFAISTRLLTGLKAVTLIAAAVLGASQAATRPAAVIELMLPWTLAVERRIPIGKLANVIVPYPTLSEVSKRVAGSFYTVSLFGDRTRNLVRALLSLG